METKEETVRVNENTQFCFSCHIILTTLLSVEETTCFECCGKVAMANQCGSIKDKEGIRYSSFQSAPSEFTWVSGISSIIRWHCLIHKTWCSKCAWSHIGVMLRSKRFRRSLSCIICVTLIKGRVSAAMLQGTASDYFALWT